jgi:hypothetical protein
MWRTLNHPGHRVQIKFFHNSAPVIFHSPYAYAEVDANLFVALVFRKKIQLAFGWLRRGDEGDSCSNVGKHSFLSGFLFERLHLLDRRACANWHA